MSFRNRSFGSRFGSGRRLTWGLSRQARSARPAMANPFFRPAASTDAAPLTIAASDIGNIDVSSASPRSRAA